MTIRYSGQVRLLTQDVVSSFAQIVALRAPEVCRCGTARSRSDRRVHWPRSSPVNSASTSTNVPTT